MQVNLIAAINRKYCIGLNGKLPWLDKEEFKLFRSKTIGHSLVMGRKTFEGVGLLPGRVTYVLTRDPKFYRIGAKIRQSPEAILADAERRCVAKLWICGGAETYNAFMPHVKQMHISWMNNTLDGDAYWVPPLSEFNGILALQTKGENFTHKVYIR